MRGPRVKNLDFDDVSDDSDESHRSQSSSSLQTFEDEIKKTRKSERFHSNNKNSFQNNNHLSPRLL